MGACASSGNDPGDAKPSIKPPEAKSPAEFLECVPLFLTLSKADLAATGEHMRPRSFGRGDVIIRQGDEGQEFFIIVRGTAEVTIKGQGVVCYYHGGDFFGE